MSLRYWIKTRIIQAKWTRYVDYTIYAFCGVSALSSLITNPELDIEVPDDMKQQVQSIATEMGLNTDKLHIGFSTGLSACAHRNQLLLPRLCVPVAEDEKEAVLSMFGLPVQKEDGEAYTVLKNFREYDYERLEFVIGHELNHIKRQDFYIRTKLDVATAGGYYIARRVVAMLWKLVAPVGVPSIYLPLLAFYGCTKVSRYFEDKLLYKAETICDVASAERNEKARQGAISHFSKAINLNKYMRDHHPSKVVAEQQYSINGDFIMDKRHPPLTERLKICSDIEIINIETEEGK